MNTILKQSKQYNNNSERHIKGNRYRQQLVPRYKCGAIGVNPNFYRSICFNTGKFITQVLFSDRFRFEALG